jgi:hypothetical protein
VPYKKRLQPFSHTETTRHLVRELYPVLGAKRTDQVAGVSTRSVYRWCADLIAPSARGRTAAAADANRQRGELRRHERNMMLLKSIDDTTDSVLILELARAIQ